MAFSAALLAATKEGNKIPPGACFFCRAAPCALEDQAGTLTFTVTCLCPWPSFRRLLAFRCWACFGFAILDLDVPVPATFAVCRNGLATMESGPILLVMTASKAAEAIRTSAAIHFSRDDFLFCQMRRSRSVLMIGIFRLESLQPGTNVLLRPQRQFSGNPQAAKVSDAAPDAERRCLA